MKATTVHFISSMFMVIVYSAVCFGQTNTPNILSTGGGYYQGATHNNSWTMGQLEYTTLQSGNYILTQGFQQPGEGLAISGKLATETGTPVPTVTINLTGSATQSMVTGNNGLYSMNVENGGNYTVTPSKSNDLTTNNGISTLDIILIQRQILAIQNLNTPYKIIAADVNASSTISTLDIVLIRSVIFANTPTFPNGRLWMFVRSDFNFSNPLIPFPFDKFRSYTGINESKTNQNFIGIKLGDVNNSWDPNTPKAGAVGEVQFAMEEYNVLPDDEIIVPVRVKDFNAIAGYQFTLIWNPEVIALLEVVNQSIPAYYGEQSISEGMLTTSWNDGAGASVTLADDAVAFELKFRVTGAIGTMSEIKIGSEFTQSEAYTNSLDLLNIAATNGMVKVGDERNTGANSLTRISLFPNPTDGSVTLEIPSHQKMESLSLKLYDALGRQMNLTPSPSPGGEGSNFSLDLKPLPGNIFFLSITTDTGSRVMKVVKY